MPEARFRFYAELNDFLSPERRFAEFVDTVPELATVKDRIESLGVPHTEIDLILVNGEPVDFTYRVRDRDRISVFPVFESFDIAGLARLRPEPLRQTRFVLDVHLGRLAAYLRMLGFDTYYFNCSEDQELAAISRDEHRILLTRDVGLLKRSAVTHGYFVRETDSRRQAEEIVKRFDLKRLVRPFTRCMQCNALLAPVAKKSVSAMLPPRTVQLYDEFQQCPDCARVYWKGGHYRRMRQWIEGFGLY